MKKGYQVCTVGWEYNDEGYNKPECDGVIPGIVYMDKAKAEEALADLQIQGFKDNNPFDYVSDGDLDAVSSLREAAFAKLNEILGTEVSEEDFWDMRDHLDLKKAPKKTVEAVVKVFNKLKFYEIREVTVE